MKEVDYCRRRHRPRRLMSDLKQNKTSTFQWYILQTHFCFMFWWCKVQTVKLSCPCLYIKSMLWHPAITADISADIELFLTMIGFSQKCFQTLSESFANFQSFPLKMKTVAQTLQTKKANTRMVKVFPMQSSSHAFMQKPSYFGKRLPVNVLRLWNFCGGREHNG